MSYEGQIDGKLQIGVEYNKTARKEREMKKIFLWLSVLGVIVFLMTEYTTANGVLTEELDQKFDKFTYVVESDKVVVGVTAFVARYREKEKYMPLEIGIANKKHDKLTLTGDSFTLIDELGNEYSLASSEELMDNYRKHAVDLRLAQFFHVSRSLFGGLSQVPSHFQPDKASYMLVRDKVELPSMFFMIDMLYFQRPITGIKGKKFEFRVSAPELEQPIQVRFRVD